MKKLFYLLLAVGLLSAPACSKKDDPQVDPTTLTPSNTVMVAVNGTPAVALANKQTVVAFGSPGITLTVFGNLADGRTLEVYFYGTPGRVATATAAPLSEIKLIKNTAPSSTQSGTGLTGNVINNPNTNLAQGTFEGAFPDGTAIKGTFRDLITN
jgi:hypothetical protein